MIQAAGAQGENGAVTPGVKQTKDESDEQKQAESRRETEVRKSGSNAVIEGEPLSREAVTQYRAVVARGNCLASDRPDIAFAVKAYAREMAATTNLSWEAVQRLATYLMGKPRLTWWYNFQSAPSGVVGFSDRNRAGCTRTRRSTSGCTLHVGQHLITLIQQHAWFNTFKPCRCSNLRWRTL